MRPPCTSRRPAPPGQRDEPPGTRSARRKLTRSLTASQTTHMQRAVSACLVVRICRIANVARAYTYALFGIFSHSPILPFSHSPIHSKRALPDSLSRVPVSYMNRGTPNAYCLAIRAHRITLWKGHAYYFAGTLYAGLFRSGRASGRLEAAEESIHPICWTVNITLYPVVKRR